MGKDLTKESNGFYRLNEIEAEKYFNLLYSEVNKKNYVDVLKNDINKWDKHWWS